MSDNIIEISENTNYSISIDTSLLQNENNIVIELSQPNIVDIINNTTVFIGDLPQGYPLDWTTGYLPISRVSGLDIVGGSGINVLNNSGIYTVAVTGTFGLTSEEVDDRVNQLLISGSGINLNYNDGSNTLTISTTGNYSSIGHNHLVSDVSGLQLLLDAKQPSGVYASGIHYHSSKDITDFNSSIDSRILLSNLQPSGNYSTIGHSHTISDVSGLQTILDNKQPSGNYSVVGHTHSASSIVDFDASVSGLLSVKNVTSGSGILVTNNSGDFTISVTGQFGLTSEQVDDRVSNLLQAGSYVNLNYNDNLDGLTISVTGLQPSGSYSIVGHSHNISEISGLQTALDNKQPSGIYASGIHNHLSSDITNFNSAVSGLLPIIANSGDNRILTSTGSSVGINAENNLTFNGSFLNVNGSGYFASGIIAGSPSIIGNSGIGQYIDISSDGLILIRQGVNPILSCEESTLFGDAGVTSIIWGSRILSDASGNYVLYWGAQNKIGIRNNDPQYTLDVNGSGNFASGLYVNNIPVSVSGHTHNSSQITNFNTSVSGLLPITNILPGSNIGISNSGSIFTVAVTGSLGLTTEEVDDRVSNLLVAGSGISLNYNDVDNSLSISTSGLQPSGNYSIVGHTHNYTDIINFSSGIQDSLTTTLLAGNFIDLIYNSGLDTLIISTTGLQPSGNYSTVGHSHVTSDITNFASGVNVLVSGIYAPLISPAFTGTPTVPTASSGNNTNQIANTQFVRTEISNLVNSAPSTLDTLNELANALGNDPNFATTVTSSLGSKAALNGAIFTGSVTIPSGTGNFNSLTINGSGISLSGHQHQSSDISNFNTSVSGLLPSITGSAFAVSSFANNIYTISVTGLQPSGNYSLVGHNHTSSDITNFNSSVSGLLPNVAGTGYINSFFNNNVYTISVSGLQPSGNYSTVGHTHTSSEITDFNSSVSGLLPVTNILAGSNIGVNSSGSVFTVSVTGQLGLTTEEVDDRIGSLLVAGSYVNLNYNDNINNLTISVTGLQPSGNYADSIHSHSSTDITNFNSEVSGLLPVKDIISGTGINISSSSGIYTITSTGSGVLADQAASLVTTVFNKTGSPIPKMTAVYINGGQGDLPTVSLAIATSDMTSAGTYGLTYEAIPNMQSGKVIVFGALTGLNTDQFNPTAPQGNVNGSVLYLSPTVSGSLTLSKPSAPNHIVTIGTIVRTHQNEGVIEVRVQNGFELEELHNVAISGASNGQFLQYNGSGLWVPSSIGNFSTLLVNGTGVSISGHNHTSSDINDFNSSVSGLLPVTNILGGSNVSVSTSGSIYTVAVTGSLGLTTEEVDDRVSNLLIAGSGISINYNDNANSLTISTIKNMILSDTVGSTNYIGKAIQGSSTGSNVWTINRTIYNSAGLVSSTGIATNVSWDNRTSVSYT